MIEHSRCQIKIISNNSLKVSDAYAKLKSFASSKELQVSCSHLPNKKKIYTVLRSPHIDKKSREQFEMRTYTSLVTLNINNNTDIGVLIKDFKESLQSGISLKIKFFNNEHLIK